MELDDTQLAIIAEDFDVLLQSTCINHKIPPLAVCAVVLARLIHLSKLSESQEDLGKLMISIGDSLLNREFNKPENLH
jgi:hypothetical protein